MHLHPIETWRSGESCHLSAVDVRTRLLDEHALIADWIAELDCLTRTAEHSGGKAALQAESDHAAETEHLVERLLPVTEGIEAHLRFEEEALCPLLQDVPAWGRDFVEWLEGEHRRQRVAIHAVVEISSRHSKWCEVRAAARLLVEEVGLHMALEHSLLCPDFLRDDVIAINQEDA